jgi:Protein of unknown function (DUF2800)
MTAHSRFSASAASRWSACPGSIVLTQDAPNTTSSAALAGTIGHEVADICLKQKVNAFQITVVEVDGVQHEVPEETQIAVNNYTEYLHSRGGQILSEVRIDYAKLLGVPKGDGFGTSDAVILLDNGDIEIHDLKLGHGIVEVSGNPQLMLYAAGVAATLEETTGEPVERVTIGIYQPAASRYGSTEEMSWQELHVEIKDLKSAAKSAIAAEKLFKVSGPTPQFYEDYTRAGEDQCKWCKHAASCPTLLAATQEVVAACTSDDFDVVSAPSLIDDAPVRKAYESIPLLENFIRAVQDEVYARALAGRGEHVGVKFVAGRAGNRKWADEEAASLQLLTVLPAETVYTKTLLSPAKAETALKKAKATSVDLSTLVTRSAPSKTIAPINDPRPEWSAEGATANDFE